MRHIVYLTARQVRQRYQISEMTFWRWLRDDTLNFPKPNVIRSRRYFNASALENWDSKQREIIVNV
jgi:predicted DNA-binding transcriptional regulator AlpA